MEAYNNSGSATRTALTFLSAWTSALHAAGYVSGVYSSAASGISDLAAAYGGSRYVLPDDIWIAHYGTDPNSTSDAYVPDSDWAAHQRIHQYNGGVDETYGGVTLNIDGDYVDGAVATAGSIIPDGTFVELAGSTAVYEIAGGAPLPVTSWAPFGGPQTVKPLTATQFAQLAAVPLDGTFLRTPAGAGYRVAGGAPFPITDWQLFGGQPQGVTIDPADIGLAGSAGAHLLRTPLPGTVVEGLPSDMFWRFEHHRAERQSGRPGGRRGRGRRARPVPGRHAAGRALHRAEAPPPVAAPGEDRPEASALHRRGRALAPARVARTRAPGPCPATVARIAAARRAHGQSGAAVGGPTRARSAPATFIARQPARLMGRLPPVHLLCTQPDTLLECAGACRVDDRRARPAGFEPATSRSGGERSIH